MKAIRPGEGRLIGAPWMPPAPAAGRDRFAALLRRAYVDAARAAAGLPAAGTARKFGVASLLAGAVDAGTAELSQAVERYPTSAEAWSDLAAAHLQRRTAAADPLEIILALTAANRALRLEPTLLAARFNRALALGLIGLVDQAAADWKEYLAMERDPAWSREARERAAALKPGPVEMEGNRLARELTAAIARGDRSRVAALVAAEPQKVREYVEENLLDDWALAESRHRDDEARRHLALAHALAGSLSAAGDDPMTVDTLAELDVLSLQDPRRHSLLRGLLAYRQGLDSSRSDDFTHGLEQYEIARRDLAAAGSPFVGWASYQVAACLYQQQDYPRAREALAAALAATRGRRYKALHGRALWLSGLMDGIEGHLSAALAAHQRVLADFTDLRERALAAKVRALLATDFELLGRREEAWRCLYPALVEPATRGQPRLRILIWEVASWLANAQGDIDSALWLQDEVVHASAALGRPHLVAGALRWKANLLMALGLRDAARKTLDDAWTYQRQVVDPALRRSLEGDLRLVAGELALLSSPAAAMPHFDAAIRSFRTTSYHYQLGRALHERALAEGMLGRGDAEERDLADAIAESERQRAAIAAAPDRITYLDRSKDLFDTMVAFQIDRRHDRERALGFSEQARARVLKDWLMASPGAALEPATLSVPPAADWASLPELLPDGTVVLEYAVLPGKTVIWVLRHRRALRFETVNMDRAALAALVTRFQRLRTSGPDGAYTAVSEQLHAVLLGPVAGELAHGERVVVVPEGPLLTLPFALLRDPRGGRYLIQDHVVSVAPSASILAVGVRREQIQARGKDLRILYFLAPDFDRQLNPTLAPLAVRQSDLSTIRAFPGSSLRVGQAATRSAFLSQAPGFEIVHFGGHSTLDAASPLFSQMLFAQDPADASRGALDASDLLRLRLPQARLVVLASCQSANGRVSLTEGVESLARPFLAAGVPAVVAALWSVDDASTADFFARFYRHLRERFDVAGALRASQLEILERAGGTSGQAADWGAFEVIGSSSP